MHKEPIYVLLLCFQKRKITLFCVISLRCSLQLLKLTHLVFFEEENVSATVANNEITILYVISHEQVMMWNSLWPTAACIFSLFKILLENCVFRSFYKKKIRENALRYDVKITIVNV